jgi:hypothetical protein
MRGTNYTYSQNKKIVCSEQLNELTKQICIFCRIEQGCTLNKFCILTEQKRHTQGRTYTNSPNKYLHMQ